jgi:hypothetical protein
MLGPHREVTDIFVSLHPSDEHKTAQVGALFAVWTCGAPTFAAQG